MDEREQMYCISCHGRGLDQKDCTCRRCKGTGYEPDTFDATGGPGRRALRNLLLSQEEPALTNARTGLRIIG